MGMYESISGSFIKIDKNGDSEGNFTAYALKPHNYQFRDGFKCSKYPVQVCKIIRLFSVTSQYANQESNKVERVSKTNRAG